MKLFGIDISTWQRNYPYGGATREGVKFAILRAGFSQTKDNQFETHYAAAKAQGWGVGAYCICMLLQLKVPKQKQEHS